MFRRKSVPLPPLAEPEPDSEHTEAVQSALEAVAALGSPTPTPGSLEPIELPELLTPVPIVGLTIGRIVHVWSGHEIRAGIVTKVHDICTGDISVFVFEPVAPCRVERFTFMGDWGYPGPGQWGWPVRG